MDATVIAILGTFGALLIGVPPAIVAMLDLSNRWRKLRGDESAVPLGASPHDADRVLLTFKEENFTRPGTFESVVAAFNERTLPPHRNYFLRAPWHSAWSARMRRNAGYLGAAFMLLVSVVSLVWLPSQPEGPFVWIPLSVACALAAAGYLWFGLREQRSLSAVRDYQDFLRRHDIRIGIEFTQSRDMHQKMLADFEHRPTF